ncbi:ChrR family anti-sigma-E factor [Aquabacter sediminis]|uniref:cadmium/peroxide/UV radiation responsive anti-sigma factor ChrR n=1 Tax=Aquabacter sediminis TaxID=3029197 RepID=UPI00237EC5F5|nr:ChrR family anti-sigma-E factor [Aquabacter sp. P-9]MDE1567474.1 ChrR family anti-sigma-E factor [Aquabacter sp. P-9]
MSVRHMPSEETLLSYAAGALKAPEAVVVSAHLALCQDSRSWVRTLSHVGGHLLEELPEEDLSGDALARALARIDSDGGAVKVAPPVNDMAELPPSLRHLPLGRWRWMGPGVSARNVLVPSDGGSRAFLLKIAPGCKMPQHSHAGSEYTCVLSGSYEDESGTFGPGDFEEADEAVDHRPVVNSQDPCICLIALEGQIQPSGPFGWLMRPFVRL